MSIELSGTSALITGASRGIGAATAITLAKAGVRRMLLHYGGHREGAEATAAAVRAEGCQAGILQADLATDEGIRSLIRQYRESGAAVDLLINNAGSLVARSRLHEFTEDLYEQVMNLNVKSVWFLTQAVAAGMAERGSGVIVNVSSIAARNGGGPGATIYAGAKATVSAITKGLAKELAPKGIRVNAVSPGTVENHFHETFSTKEMLDAAVRQTPAGTLGTNEEVADTILFLCSPAARYIHGQTLEINGGMYMV